MPIYKLVKDFPCYGGVEDEFDLESTTLEEAKEEAMELMNLRIVELKEE